MAQVDADRNLLFGVLALQHDLIDARQFADACALWAVRKESTLAAVLAERGWITAEDCGDVERFLARKLKKHGGDVRATLGAVALPEACDAIRRVDDPEVRASLDGLPPRGQGHVLLETLARPPGQRSRYTLTRLHARGGLGQVWLARDIDLNRQVALKEIRSEQAHREEACRRFLREAQVTGQLEHPNIVPVYELARRPEDDQPFYTMRFVRGRTLRDAIAELHGRRGRGKVDALGRQALLNAFAAVCQAVAYAHSRGVIHRDLKPENVVLGEFGEVIVLDWGLAKVVGEPVGDEPAVAVAEADEAGEAGLTQGQIGTPAYMAPEQAEARHDLVDARTDIYGLGAILFEVLTGRPPHEGEDTGEVLRRIVARETPRSRATDPTVPRPLDAICARAMAKVREARYPVASGLAEDVQRWLADEPVSALEERWAARAARWLRHHRTAARAASAALLAVCLVSIAAALLVEHARRLERAERRRADVLTERRRREVEERQARGLDLIARGDRALASDDLREAYRLFDSARAALGPAEESPLRPLRDLAGERIAQFERRLARMKGVEARARFLDLRDEALFHGTLLGFEDAPTDLRAAEGFARQALESVRLAPEGSGGPERIVGTTDDEWEEVLEGCYEMLIVVAQAVAPGVASGGTGEAGRPTARALRILDRAAALRPASRAVHLERARCLLLGGRTEEAEAEGRAAKAVEPRTAADWYLVGLALSRQEEPEKALGHFERALRLQPDHFWALYFSALCHLRASRPAEARACLTACAARRPRFARTYLVRGLALGELAGRGEPGALEAAEADFRKAERLDPKDYGLFINRGALRARTGRLDEAIADFERARALRPGRPPAYLDLAVAYWRRGEAGRALETLDEAIARHAESAAAYRLRARVLADLDRPAEALAVLERALEREPPVGKGRAEDLLIRSRVLILLGKGDQAVASLEEAVRADPGNARAHEGLGNALAALGRDGRAVEELGRAIALGREEAEVFSARGQARGRLGDSRGALDDFDRALVLRPRSRFDLGRRGWAYLNHGAELALRDFEVALAEDRGDADAHNGRGYALAMIGRYDEGVDEAREALRLAPQGGPIAFNAACILAQAAGKAGGDLARADHRRRAEAYRAEAVDLIRKVLRPLPAATAAAVWRDRIANEPAFEPLRDSEAFLALEPGRSAHRP